MLLERRRISRGQECIWKTSFNDLMSQSCSHSFSSPYFFFSLSFCSLSLSLLLPLISSPDESTGRMGKLCPEGEAVRSLLHLSPLPLNLYNSQRSRNSQNSHCFLFPRKGLQLKLSSDPFFRGGGRLRASEVSQKCVRWSKRKGVISLLFLTSQVVVRCELFHLLFSFHTLHFQLGEIQACGDGRRTEETHVGSLPICPPSESRACVDLGNLICVSGAFPARVDETVPTYECTTNTPPTDPRE